MEVRLSKVNLNPVLSGYRSIEGLNSAFGAIVTAFDNTLSRDGTSPNEMNASLDMNGQQILNLPHPDTDLSPIRATDLTAALADFAGTPAAPANIAEIIAALIDAGFTTGLNPKSFGAIGDGDTHPINSGHIVANPQWIGTYVVGDEWDFVGHQECFYAALANNPSSVAGSPVWNESTYNKLNRKVVTPAGNYRFNKTLLISGAGINWEFETRLATRIDSYVSNAHCVRFDTMAYGRVYGLSIRAQVPTTAALVGFDVIRLGDRLATQQLNLEDWVIDGNFLTSQSLCDINRVVGGTGQGDTINIVNCYTSNCVRHGWFISGQNALAIKFIGGDSQHIYGNDVHVQGGSIYWSGRNSEPGVSVSNNTYNFVAPTSKFSMGTGLIGIPSGAGESVYSSIRDCRSEGTIICPYGVNYTLDNVRVAGADVSEPYTNFVHTPAWVLGDNVTAKLAMVVDDGGAAWTSNFGYLVPDAATSTPTVLSFPSQSFGDLTGKYVRFTYTNGYTLRFTILSNTATTVTLTGSTGTNPGQYHYARICGKSGSSAPNFTTLPAGYLMDKALGNGLNATASATTFTVVNHTTYGYTPAVGDYLVVPDNDVVNPPTSDVWQPVPVPFIARVTAYNSGTSVATINRPFPTNLSDSMGYMGTPQVWGDIKIIELDALAIGGVSAMTGTPNLPYGRVRSTGDVRFRSRRKDCYRLFPRQASTGVIASDAVVRLLPSISGYDPGGTPRDVADDWDTLSVIGTVIAADQTYTYSGAANRPGKQLTVIITTQGASSRTVTFGSGFKPNGTLATGTTSGKKFVLTFINDGTEFVEVSRTTAL